MKTNCPNCGAPIEPYKCRCEYCGTWYFDFTVFDMSGSDPYYIKFRSPYGVITTLAKPELRTIEVNEDYQYVTDHAGHKIARFSLPRSCDFGVIFHAVPDPADGTLYKLMVDNGEKVLNSSE